MACMQFGDRHFRFLALIKNEMRSETVEAAGEDCPTVLERADRTRVSS